MLLPITVLNGDRLSKFIHQQLSKVIANIPPHLKCVATLTCKMLMSENQQHTENVL